MDLDVVGQIATKGLGVALAIHPAIPPAHGVQVGRFLGDDLPALGINRLVALYLQKLLVSTVVQSNRHSNQVTYDVAQRDGAVRGTSEAVAVMSSDRRRLVAGAMLVVKHLDLAILDDRGVGTGALLCVVALDPVVLTGQESGGVGGENVLVSRNNGIGEDELVMRIVMLVPCWAVVTLNGKECWM